MLTTTKGIFVFSFYLSLSSFVSICGAAVTPCSNGGSFGVNAINVETDLDTTPGLGHLMLSSDVGYTITCCGIVTGWEFYAPSANDSQALYLQIWRPNTDGSYMLAGQNEVIVSSGTQDYDISIPQPSRITIKENDRFGWWTAGDPVIAYKPKSNNGGGSSPEVDDNYLMVMSATTEGDSVTWSGVNLIFPDRTYQIRLTTRASNVPQFDTLPDTVTLSNAVSVGTLFYNVTITDIDTDDIPTLSLSMTYSASYSFDPVAYSVTTATSLAGAGRIEKLEFVAIDQCEKTSTGTLTIVITNDPPVIHNLPNATYLNEDTEADLLLHVIDVTDTDGTATCSLQAAVDPFVVRQMPSSSDYAIYCGANPGGFDYDIQNTYTMTVVCTDGYLSDTGTFTVYLQKNSAPVFLNLQNSTGISTNSSIGTKVFTVLTSDVENDDLTYSMTCDPTPCPFQIYASGDILVTEDISTHTTVGYDIEIFVSDGKNDVGPGILTVVLLEINDPVTIEGLPVSMSVIENTAVGTSVYTVSYSDQDTTQAHTFTMTSTPASGLSYFSIDTSTGLISTSAIVNYEALGTGTTFTFDVTVSDPVTSSSGILTIDIINMNEAPTFSQSSYSLSADEGSAGTVLGTPAFGITDPDSGDTTRLSLDCGVWTGYFIMDATSGQVSYQSNYDLDTGSLPFLVPCTVTVTDSGGLTDTASLSISIADRNDNTPIFSPGSYSFFISYYASAGTTVGTITATDGDAGSFGVLTYSLDQSSLLQEHFSIDNNGVITVKMSPTASLSALNYSSSASLTATASDAGGLFDTASVVIVVSDTTTTSTTTTTDRYRSFFEDARNLTWFVTAMLVLGASVLVVTWVVYTCRGNESCAAFKRLYFRPRRGRGFRRRQFRPREPSPVSRAPSPEFEPVNHIKETFIRKPPPPKEFQSWRSDV